ncbi:MAG: DNA (cytosine-5-)-methyltransferase [Aridibacter sp.]
MEISNTSIKDKRIEVGLSQAKLAELADISQHLLSAHELEKSSLSSDKIKTIQKVLDNISELEIKKLNKKRYQNHSFKNHFKDAERAKKNTQTEENKRYISKINKLDKNKNNKKQGKVISLFSGCGGFSLGFSWANFEVLGFVELNEAFREINKQNFPDSLELGFDIREINNEQISEWKSRFGEIDVVIGGPPCQGFSLSGKRNANDPRNTLFKNYLKIVRELKPKIAVMENVRLLTSMKVSDGSLILNQIYQDFDESDYNFKHFEINAKNYGIPQHRERVIFVAMRKDLGVQPSIPLETHGENDDLFSQVEPFRTFADACSDLEFLESGEESKFDKLHKAVKHPDHVIEWLWNVKQGKSAHENENPNLRPPSGYNTTYKRQIWLEPASTVQTTFGMISGCRNVHPIATRSLTIREAARIQSFPDSFKFSGTLGNIRATIGNALPPLLAYKIAKHIKENLL